MLDKSIQRLRRWTSNAFKLYFTTIPETMFNLNLSFQKGIPLAVPWATVQGPTVIATRGPKLWRRVSLKSWTRGGEDSTYNPLLYFCRLLLYKMQWWVHKILWQPSLKNLTTNHRQHLFGYSLLGRIVSYTRPLGLEVPRSGTARLQSLYPGERSSFPGGLLAPLSLEVTDVT